MQQHSRADTDRQTINRHDHRFGEVPQRFHKAPETGLRRDRLFDTGTGEIPEVIAAGKLEF